MNYFIKKPQTTIALTFLTHIISAIGGVCTLKTSACADYATSHQTRQCAADTVGQIRPKCKETYMTTEGPCLMRFLVLVKLCISQNSQQQNIWLMPFLPKIFLPKFINIHNQQLLIQGVQYFRPVSFHLFFLFKLTTYFVQQQATPRIFFNSFQEVPAIRNFWLLRVIMKCGDPWTVLSVKKLLKVQFLSLFL